MKIRDIPWARTVPSGFGTVYGLYLDDCYYMSLLIPKNRVFSYVVGMEDVASQVWSLALSIDSLDDALSYCNHMIEVHGGVHCGNYSQMELLKL